MQLDAIQRERYAQFMANVDQHVKAYGQSVVGVGGGPGAAFSYTIGNALRGLPELLFIGNVQFDLQKMILNEVGRALRASGEPFPDDRLLELNWSFPFKVRNVADPERVRRELTCQAGEFLGREDYAVQQVMICDPAGRYPGEAGVEPRYNVERP